MKKVALAILLSLIVVTGAYAGGIVTNTNQSAEFIRTLNRNASTETDAVYFNPAAVAMFDEGFHTYLSNQTVIQTRTIDTVFPTYNENRFEGETTAPIFPNVYVAYNTGKMALSLGITPIGGGGSAEFPKGLPSFDYQLARFVGLPAKLINSSLEPYGEITGYSMDASFTGSSIYIGGQFGVAYELNPMISLAGGFRIVSAKNTYEGALKNVILNADNGDISGVIPNINVDAERTGIGYTGIAGINFTPMSSMNIGLRYETKTSLELETDTRVDDTSILGDPMFPDGEKIPADMPAMIAAGISYSVFANLRVEGSYTYYLNSGVDWEENSEDYVDNSQEIGLAVEYAVFPNLELSIGGLKSTMGAMKEYQSDLSYSLDSQSLGTGFQYHFTNGISASVGFSKTFYELGENARTGVFAEEYDKTSVVYAFGIHYSL